MYQNILECIRYYGIQGKALTEPEIVRYITSQTTTTQLRSILDDLVHEGKLVKEGGRHALTAHQGILANFAKREIETEKKRAQIALYLSLLKLIPWIQYIGLTGSCGISNAAVYDDVDLMIITSPNRLFISRLIAISISLVLGLKRRRGVPSDPGKVCMNLWLDESDLRVPPSKRSLYAARESAQMRPLYDKAGTTYHRFFYENEWISNYLPNVHVEKAPHIALHHRMDDLPRRVLDILELLSKKLQLRIMRAHQTTELVTATQLWFHPLDRSHLS